MRVQGFDDRTVPQGLAFDDVLLVPQRNRVSSRREVTTAMQLTPNIRLSVPIVSANTPWCTGAAMAIAMARCGGLGIVHRMMPAAEAAEAIAEVKAAPAGTEPHATTDQQGRLRVGGAIGIRGDYLERAAMLVERGVDLLAIDVAHGHSDFVIEALGALRQRFAEVELLAGNVATAEGTQDLIDAGASCIKVGIGPGSVCTTRQVAGAGVPQLTAISACAQVARARGVGLIADGGVLGSGDIVKALAAGASAVMLGKLLAGTDESEAEAREHEGRRYKVTTGFVTLGAELTIKRLTGGEVTREEFDNYLPEGVEGTFEHSGKVADVVGRLVKGLQSGVSYSGCRAADELADRARFIRISPAGQRESRPHVLEGVPALHPDYAARFVQGGKST